MNKCVATLMFALVVFATPLAQANPVAPKAGVNKINSPVALLISLGMPKESLSVLLHDAHCYGIPVVLRGLKDDSFGATLAALRQLGGDAAGVVVDPTVFTTYEVHEVPTLLINDSRQVMKLMGNVSLEYSFHWLARNTPWSTSILAPYLAKEKRCHE